MGGGGDLWQGTYRFSRPGDAANLVDAWIPAREAAAEAFEARP